MHSPTHSEYLNASAVEVEGVVAEAADGASKETRPVVQRCNTIDIACKRLRRLPLPK